MHLKTLEFIWNVTAKLTADLKNLTADFTAKTKELPTICWQLILIYYNLNRFVSHRIVLFCMYVMSAFVDIK